MVYKTGLYMKEILLILMISILCERYVFITYISMINDNSIILYYNIRGYIYITMIVVLAAKRYVNYANVMFCVLIS